ncbi:hypothetical protein DFH08DRAFT_956184 [Mycena albidolilacea]|uniref:Uncharacterized protein n=1 Tax=Mycena albidolilacea TaxID=1033008 RepID=A0AAD7EXF3_9AGAR|nr:hypothetical protein DFH08DRAFT_956184 [Mycena albidolilacea]
MTALGGASVYKERFYNLVVQYIPVSFEPGRDRACEVVEDDNNLPQGALAQARWIKPIERCRDGQRVAHAVFRFNDPTAANRVIRDGVWAIGSNHIAATCRSIHDACARCGEMHRTNECTVPNNKRACCNCRAAHREHRGHGVADRSCPVFEDLLQRALERNPEAAHPYFLVEDDPATWVSHNDVGAAFTSKRGTPEWKRKPAVQRGPGPSPPVAAALHSQMARGKQGPARQTFATSGGGAGHQNPPGGDHQDHQVDAWMHIDRAPQLTMTDNARNNTPDTAAGPSRLTRRQKNKAQAVIYREAGGLLVIYNAATTANPDTLLATGQLDWDAEVAAHQASVEYGLRPISKDDDSDLVAIDAPLDNISPPAMVDGSNV